MNDEAFGVEFEIGEESNRLFFSSCYTCSVFVKASKT